MESPNQPSQQPQSSLAQPAAVEPESLQAAAAGLPLMVVSRSLYDELAQCYQKGEYLTLYERLSKLTPQPHQLTAPEFDREHGAPELLHLMGLCCLQLSMTHEGLAYLQAALKLKPESVDWSVHAGIALWYAGQFEASEKMLKHVLTLSPDHPQAMESLAQLYQASGQYDRADEQFQTLLRRHPQHVTGRYHYGLFLQSTRRDLGRARRQYEKVLAANPDLVEARLNLATILSEEQATWEEASKQFWQILASVGAEDVRASALSGLAVLSQAMGNMPQALQHLKQAVKITGYTRPDLFHSLALAHRHAGAPDEADRLYQLLVMSSQTLLPTTLKNALSIVQMAVEGIQFYSSQSHLEKARDFAERVLSLQWDAFTQLTANIQGVSPEAVAGMLHWSRFVGEYGQVCMELGDTQQAQMAYEQQQDMLDGLSHQQLVHEGNAGAYPLLGGIMHQCALTPVVPAHEEEIRQAFASREAAWEALQVRWPQQPKQKLSVAEVSILPLRPSFYTNYVGEPQGTHKGQLADWLQSRVEWPADCPPDLPLTFDGSRPCRLGIQVSEGHESIFLTWMRGMLQQLGQSDRFQVIMLVSPVTRERLESHFQQLGVTCFWLVYRPEALEAALKQTRAFHLDMVYYFEVGTDSDNFLLPLLRLAPVQFTSWGLPVSSGVGEMDYFLSAEALSPLASSGGGGQNEFMERVVSLPDGFPAWLRAEDLRPLAEEARVPRSMLNLPTQESGIPLLCCPHQVFKYHPHFVKALIEILRQLPTSRLVLLEGMYASWTEKLRAAFREQGADVLPQIQWLPRLSKWRYLSLLAEADLVLDSFYYGGGTTSLETLTQGTPVLTLPDANQLASRLTLSFYRQSALLAEPTCDTLIAPDAAAYVAQAVAWVQQPIEDRQAFRERILQAVPRLAGTSTQWQQLEATLLAMAQKRY
jgi:tetratricopeptide (TPR) repeat protein